jgi:hypothetical protein
MAPQRSHTPRVQSGEVALRLGNCSERVSPTATHACSPDNIANLGYREHCDITPKCIETVDMGIERTHVPVNRFSNFRQREFRPSDCVGKVRCGSDECVAVEELSR